MNIWEGIYATFAEAGGTAQSWGDPSWVGRCRVRAADARAASNATASAPTTIRSDGYCLPTLAAVVHGERGAVRILDFGGAAGVRFPETVDGIPEGRNVEVHIVDNPAVCDVGRQVFAGDSRITFHSVTPPDVAFDIVHLGSSIQYIEDWAALLANLVACRPRFLVLDDVPAGDIPTFVSLQEDYGRKIPHWFFNLESFVSHVTMATGYRLFYRARYLGSFLGQRGPFPMGNFPTTHRIDNAWNFVFGRT